MKRYREKIKCLIRPLLLFCIIAWIVLGVGYVYCSWRSYQLQEKHDAIVLTESAAAFIEPNQITALKGSPEDILSPIYETITRNLIEFQERNEYVKFAYLLMCRENKLYFMVDSELPGSQGYSPPGQEYHEATEQDKLPFSTGEAILTDPETDRWGTWVSALVPIKDDKTGDVIAVLGIDYPAEYWSALQRQHVTRDIIVVACILLLLIGIYFIYSSNIKLKTVSSKLKESESLFRTVFEQAPVGIALVNGFQFCSEVNMEFAKILGRSKEEFDSLSWIDITHPDDLNQDMELFKRFKAGEIPGYSMEKRYLKPDGTVRWIQMVVARIHISEERTKTKNHLCIIQDIHTRKMAEEALLESERSKSMLLSNLPGLAYRCSYDKDWTMQFLSEGCYDLIGYEPRQLLYNNELSYNDLIAPEFRKIIRKEWARVLRLRIPFRYEYEIITAQNEHKWVLEIGQGVFEKDQSVKTLEGIIIDMTESKKRLDRIQYMDAHDFMTGLCNRQTYEIEKARLHGEGEAPISIIMADINGVRLINDAFGHEEGDRMIVEMSKIMSRCCRKSDLLARTGGDEFTILLPNTSREEACEVVNRIKAACEAYNQTISNTERYINISIGFGTKDTPEDSLEEAEKEAEEYLRKRKLFESKSYHNAILSSIMATMYARSQETEEHAQRIAKVCRCIGEQLNLSQKSLDELHLFSVLHDIGKVGIDDRILNKPGKLTEEEWIVMRTHPEIGYRIAMSVPELESVADCVLTHHEKWNGEGYPQGKRGDEIPLLSRILAVADAYDAMTKNRAYRTAMSGEAAINEIRKNAGIQFDPEIVSAFVETMREPVY